MKNVCLHAFFVHFALIFVPLSLFFNLFFVPLQFHNSNLSFGSYKMELNRNLCAFSAGSKALRAGRYNGDAKAIVLCVAHNFHERQRVYFHFYFLFYFRKL